MELCVSFSYLNSSVRASNNDRVPLTSMLTQFANIKPMIPNFGVKKKTAAT